MTNKGYPGASVQSDKKIGVFDSGVGGLTVLNEIVKQLPSESVLYFGDTARLPYGERSQSEIVRFVREIIHWMLAQGVKMVVMACNTSSALALEMVQAEFDIPILGIILPGARAATKAGRRIGVISTQATAQSNAYRQAILEANSNAQVWQVGCSEFVPLIEQNRIHHPYTVTAAQRYLAPLLDAQIDTLIYGCTHYPHLAPVIQQILPPWVTLVNPAEHLVRAMAKELDVLGLRCMGGARREPGQELQPYPQVSFYVSGEPTAFAELSAQWLSHRPLVQALSLSTLTAGISAWV
ncbi:MAG: glutamate racemase [Cyanobacteria bacterium P01_D01_bin.14]